MAKYMVIILLQILFSCNGSNNAITADVCIYGGTSAGVICAIQLAKEGKTVIIVEPTSHLGGMTTQGLGGTDINNHEEFNNDTAVGGLALEFYKKVAVHYEITDFENQRNNSKTWRFEPHVAEKIFNDWLNEYSIPVHINQRLKLNGNAVKKERNKVVQFETESGKIFKARIFIDATYEGDLLHYAGISTTIGRESNSKYNETKNGIRVDNNYKQFEVKIDPYVIPGDSSSGTIHTVQNEHLRPENIGKGDQRIQAYCFRACLTKESENRVLFRKPENYHRDWYEIYLRYLEAGGKLYSPGYSIPKNKTDFGAWHDLSHNLYGMNHDWPGGDYDRRMEIYQYHLDFTQGLFWFLANDNAVPLKLREKWSQWGTTKDEFTDNDGWPGIIYIRDGRRMISDYVITEHHTRRDTTVNVVDPVGVAFWPPDVHHVRRIIKDGAVYNEGFVFGGNNWRPFSISYRALVPKKNESINMMTPTCPSSSHIAFGAIRLEWTFMVLGQSLGCAASICLDQNIPVQMLDYEELEEELINEGQVLSL